MAYSVVRLPETESFRDPGSPEGRPPAGRWLLGPWRRAFQWTVALAVFLVPFVRVRGDSLLRVDLPAVSLVAFGRVFPVEELYLLLLLVLALLFTFVAATLLFGRLWCGWACPQTVLADALEGFARIIGARVRAGRIEAAPWRMALIHLFAVGIGFLAGATLVWYFLPPHAFFPLLLRGALPAPAAVALLAVGAAAYLDLAFLRRTFCRDLCPYGRFQAALSGAGTLSLKVPEAEAERCLDCGSCVRACPTGIDVRRGYQVECIYCGRCLDACREVFSPRGEKGIIGYVFGSGLRTWLGPRTALLLATTLAAWFSLGAAVVHRAPIGISVRRAPLAEPRQLADGRAAVFFSGVLANRTQAPLTVTLSAVGPGGETVEVRGPVQGVSLRGGERRKADFALLAPSRVRDTPGTALLRWTDGSGRLLATTRVSLALDVGAPHGAR